MGSEPSGCAAISQPRTEAASEAQGSGGHLRSQGSQVQQQARLALAGCASIKLLTVPDTVLTGTT